MLSSLSSLYDTVRSYSPLAGKPGAKRQRSDDKEDVIITDVLQQTPPAKRIRNSTEKTEAGTNSKSSIKGISEFVTKKFKSWSDKYIWWYVVKGKTPKNSEKLTSGSTDSEGKEMAEERFKRPVDALRGCKTNVSTNNWSYERGSTLTRKPIGDRWLESPSVFTCTSTPARNTCIVTKPEKMTASTYTWHSSTRKEPCSRKKYGASRYMDSADMSPDSTQPPIEQMDFTVGRYAQDTSQFGKAPWRSQTKQSRQASTKKSVKRHYRIISTAETQDDDAAATEIVVVRLKERERYRELVSQYTGTPIDISSDTATENLNATRVSMIRAPLEVKTDFLTKSQSRTRVIDGSLLSPRSSLLPPSVPFNVSPTPPQPPVVLQVMPSPSKYKPTPPASDVNLFSRPGISEVPYQCSAVKSSSKLPSNATFCNPFDEGWTKRWRDLLSEGSLSKERDISKEQRKLDALKQKRQEDSRVVVEKVRQRRRREELGLEELDYTEDEEEEDDDEEEAEGAFVSLTDEMEREIDAALAPGNPDDPVVKGFRVVIKRSDMATLSNLNWLNDEIINFYFTLIMERSKEQDIPKVHAFNSFFYPKLVKSGYASLRRWTKKVDIFEMDLVLVPIHLGMHWCLAVIDMTKKCISYYDSLKGSNPQCLLALRSYLNEESLDKKKAAFDITGWTTSSPSDIPEQLNGCDCGVFACKYAEYLSRRTKFDFDQRHMPYFRRRMVYEILSKKLL